MPILSALVALACLPGPTGAPLDAAAGCGRVRTGYTETNAVRATLSPSRTRAYAGRTSLRAAYPGGSDNALARGVLHVSWRAGDDVWYGAAFYLPRGFTAAMQGEVALLRWDNWPSYRVASADVGGLVIWGSDRRARVKVGSYNEERELVGPFRFPEGRWVWAEVHQRFSARDGAALTEVFLDGRRVGRSTRANMAGRTIERLRTGLVAIEGGRQTRPLTLWFDRPTVSAREIGPLAG